MQPNKTKAKLKAGEAVFGCFIRYPEPSLAEMMGYQGWDFLVFDAEHGVLDPRECENLVRAAELRGVTAMVRLTTNQPPITLRFMDSGAQGVHVPWVNTVLDAEAAVRSVKYYPRGIRGLAGVRAADFGQTMPLGDYVKQANAETLVVLQIETVEAVKCLPEIVEIDGVDVVFIGPMDLSQSLGVPGQPQHPSVLEVMQRICEVVLSSKVALGIMTGNAKSAREWQARGARYISTTIESLLNPAAREYLNRARE